MGKIIIKGDFTIEGDLPALDKMCKRFKFMELETREIPSISINQMTGIKENKHPDVFIGRAALCTVEGIRSLCGTDEEYSAYVEKIKKERQEQKCRKDEGGETE